MLLKEYMRYPVYTGENTREGIYRADSYDAKNVNFPFPTRLYRLELKPFGDLVHEIDLETNPLVFRYELERRVDEVGADTQLPRPQRRQ